VLVIGLDGGTFELIGPWLEAGELPRLKALMDSGVHGDLLSVLPPLSPPAWTSAVTGVNPGAHGIFDFQRVDFTTRTTLLETGASRRVPALWTLLSDGGRRVGVVNVPMSDPPDPVNGFMVSGFPHPDSIGIAYPEALEKRIHRFGYRLDTMGGKLLPGHEAELRAQFLDTFHARRRLALQLGAENPDLDLYWVVFTATDRMQHFFWKFMEKDHPFYDPALAPEFGDSIKDLWKEIDAAVGELVDQAAAQADDQGRELAVLVLSDHGFTGVHRAFRPQSFLRHPTDGAEPVTAAYSLETNASMLYVPVEGREAGARRTQEEQQAMLDEIHRRILAARDTARGNVSPVLFGAKAKDIYTGRYVDKAPDLVYLPRNHYYFINEAGDKDPFGTPEFTFSAHHKLNGMLIAQGPMFRTGLLEGKQTLLDIAPTVMYLAGLEVPGYMEGDVLTATLKKDYLERRPVRRDRSEARETGGTGETIRSIPYVQ